MSNQVFAGPPLITKPQHLHIEAHYGRALEWLTRHFGETPVFYATYPDVLGRDAAYHKSIVDAPKTISTVEVRTATGSHSYVRLNAHNVTWLVAGRFAVELLAWSPSLDDPARAAFGRILLAPSGTVPDTSVVAAAELVRDALLQERLQSIAVLDGFRGVAIWIPLADGPDYDRLSTWLHAFAAKLAERYPAQLTTAPRLADRGNRISLGTKSNHPGMGSLLPYALRGTPGLEVAIPVAWGDLPHVPNGSVTASGFAEYQRLFGDVFAKLRAEIGAQTFGVREGDASLPRVQVALSASEPTPTGYIIAAALQILADGKAHDADEILTQALARNLLPASTSRKYVYTALHEYVVRTLGAGRIPRIVQAEGSSVFRLNEPEDTWPGIEPAPLPRWLATATATALTQRLRDTSTGTDAEAFEVAACDAFAALGFVAKHVGGNGAPDGVLAAPLGTVSYRAILECKTAKADGVVANPRAEEAAKFRADYDATLSVLLGPAFGNDAALDAELMAHAVSLWTVDDVCGCIDAQIGPDELRPLFAPGRAERALTALLWERDHGRRKRVAVIADFIARQGWAVQQTFANGVAAAQTPALTEETLFVLVDEELARIGVAAGATLDEAREAMRQLETSYRLRCCDGSYIVMQPPDQSR